MLPPGCPSSCPASLSTCGPAPPPQPLCSSTTLCRLYSCYFNMKKKLHEFKLISTQNKKLKATATLRIIKANKTARTSKDPCCQTFELSSPSHSSK